ncbi:MAG TPA: PAS domain S-box protein, partial [Syntrophales bacterium]|nr:PAS domain S-box protein [Syntrophales bacterium]
MRKPLRVLFVEDSEDDALLVFHILMKSSYDPTYERVDRPEAMRSALLKNEWDIILADYLMPGFSGIAALKLLKETGLDIPFIIVSGKIGEETAVEAMKAGAHDYIMKDDLKRLIPAINRGLKEASVRKEHRQAEEALKKSEESYRTLVENLNVGVYRNTGDPQGRFIQANPAIARMFGYDSVDEFMKIKVSDLYEEPEDRKSFVDAIKQTGTIINKELHLRRKDNKSIWTSVSARAHYDNNGGIDWIDGVIEDITDRKQAERLLQESEARYRAIVEAYDGYIYICSQDYRVEFMNERLIERAGYDGTGEKCYKVLHDRDSICPWCVNDRVFKGENVRWEVLSPKDNRWLYVMNTPIYHLDGSISKQSLFLDITDRKRMEEELRQAHDNLEKLVEERTAELSEKNRQLLEEIEERKRTEKALRESEERFRRLHEASFGGIAIHDKGLILEANQGLAAMTGYELSELVGMDGLKLIDTKWRDLVMKNILSDFEKPYEVVGLRTDGSTYPLEIQGKVIPYQGRKVRVTEFRDITERKRAENRLRESEEKYRHIYENIQDIYYEVSIGGIILELSPSIENLSKYKRVELIGKSIYEIYAYREEREEFLRTIRKTGRVTDYEVKMKDEDGRLLTMSLCSLLVFDEKGIPYKIVGTIRDVTERKKAEEALRESEIKYRLIFETTAAATMIIEEDSTISLVNTEFEKLSGYSKEEMEGKRKWTEFVVQNDLAKMQEYHRLRRIDPTAAPRNYEFQFVSRDGSIRDAFLTIAVIPETKKSVASILDITKRKQAEAAARESEARLRALINNLPFEFWGMDSNLYYIMQNTISIKNYG